MKITRVLFMLVGLVVMADRYLALRAKRELPMTVGSGRSCEGILSRIPFFKAALEKETQCYLKFARERFSQPTQIPTEESMLRLTSLFSAEERLSPQALKGLMEIWIGAHARVVHSEATTLEQIKEEFDLAEGLIGIMEFFEVDELDLSRRRSDLEDRRKQKLSELFQLSVWVDGMRRRMRELESKSAHVKSSAELTLLQMRIQKMNRRMRNIPSRWKLRTVLDSLKVEDTYPEQYQKIGSMISVEK